MIHEDVGEVLFTKDAMAARTLELGREIGSAYAGKRPLLMPILKGRIRRCVHAQQIQWFDFVISRTVSICGSSCIHEVYQIARHFIYGIIAGFRGLHFRGRPYPSVWSLVLKMPQLNLCRQGELKRGVPYGIRIRTAEAS